MRVGTVHLNPIQQHTSGKSTKLIQQYKRCYSLGRARLRKNEHLNRPVNDGLVGCKIHQGRGRGAAVFNCRKGDKQGAGGETLSFSLPLVMAAMKEEARMPFRMINNRNFKYVRDYNYLHQGHTLLPGQEGSIHIIVQQTLPVAGVEAASFAAAAASFAAVVASSIALRCCFINLAISSES